MTIFLLGPDQWDDGVAEPWPAWAALADPDLSFTPKHFRLEIKHAIERDSEGRVKAVVMDDSLKPKGKDLKDDELFHHIETTLHVTRYFIIVPNRTKVLGTIFEGGMLVRDFHYGRNPEIVLLFEDEYANADEEGNFSWTKGKRTEYLTSLAARAHHVDTWGSLEECLDLAVEQALA